MAKLEDSNLALQMDKIAYGAAAVIGLAILVVAFTSGGGLSETIIDIRDGRATLESRMRDDPPPRPVPRIAETIAKQWDVPPAAVAYPKWTTHRKPSFAQWVAQKGAIRARHAEPKITRISYQRNRENWAVYLVVEAEVGEASHAKIVGAELYRKVGDGAFEKVKRPFGGEEISPGKALAYEDHDVEPGQVYAYKLSTRAEAVPVNGQKVLLVAEDEEKTSAACGLTKPIPHNYKIRMQYARPFSAETNVESDFLAGTIYYGSAEPGVDPIEVPFPEGKTNYPAGTKFGPTITRGGRKMPLFEILTISGEDKVTIRIQHPRTKEDVTRGDHDDRDIVLPLPVECSDVAEPAADASGDAPSGEIPAVEEETPPEPEATPPEAEEKPEKEGGPFR